MKPVRIMHVSPALPVDVCKQAIALSEKGWLSQLFTSTASTQCNGLNWLNSRWMSRRRVGIRREELRSVFMSDVDQRLRLLAGGSPVEAADDRFRRVDIAASRNIDDGLSAVICREDAAAKTFQSAEKRGILRIYDLPIAHFKFTWELMRREIEDYPELERSLLMPDEYSLDRLANKERELTSATHILCPSQFVKRSLLAAGYDDKSVHVLPFACDPSWLSKSPEKSTNVVLCVGQVSPRKGVHRLLKVWKQLRAYRTHTLRLVGDLRLPAEYLRQYNGLYEHTGRLPRSELISEYASAKLFVSNAMSEGMAVVVPEALSTGTPVIASRNSGAEEIITDNEEGLLVDYGDDDALAASIERLLGSPDLLAHMRERAAEKARAQTWRDYSLAFIRWISSLVAEGGSAESAENPH